MSRFWIGIALFAVIFMAWGLIVHMSSEHAVNSAEKQIEQEINFPQPYSGVNSSEELAIAKIEKGTLLVEKGKKNIGTSIMESSIARAITEEGLKEIKEGLKC